MICSRTFFLSLIILSLISQTVHADYNSQRIGFSHSYPNNFKAWEEAFLAGNGKMGIMVFGNPLNETVVYNDRGFNIAANTNTPVRSVNQVSTEDLEAIKSNCVAGNFAEANRLAATAPHGHAGGEGNRNPGYEMLISIPEDGVVTNYSRTCDFRTGEITVKWTDNRGNWERKAFVSRKDNVIVQYLTAPSGGKINCSIQLTTDPGMSFSRGWKFTPITSPGSLNMRVNYPADTGSAGYEGVTRVVTKGGTKSVNGNVLNISNADSVMLLTRTEKYYINCTGQWNKRLIKKQLAEIPADYQTLLKGQIATHEAIFDRVKLDLGASPEDRAKSNEELLAMQKDSSEPVKALWERVFDAGRYYYLSSSSSNTPPDLLGIWTGDCNAGWGGWYHLDANLNLQIAQGNIGDMPEAMEGYFHIMEHWRSDFQTNALKLLGSRGFVSPGNTPGISARKGPSSMSYPYQYATGEEGWLLYPFWEHYLVTGDTNFLRERLFPLLKGMGEFYEDFLTKTDTNGNYIFAGSVSPENQPSNIRVSLVNNSDFDISGAKFCLTALIQACDILGLDQGAGQGVERWTAILKKLPPYLVGEPNNSIGALAEWSWPGIEDNFNHRHSSGLLSVWPFREITPETTPALFKAALNTLTEKDKYNYENAGHGLLHSALIAANLKDATSVNTKLLRLTREGFYYDSLCSSHYNNHGVFCTDTCNAVPGIMMEMLISSSPGILELLPALPETLTQGSISGVKGRNRVTVENLSWNMKSNSVDCILKSDIDQSVTLIERSGIETVKTSSNVSPSPIGQIARVIQLKAGASTPVSIELGQFRTPN